MTIPEALLIALVGAVVSIVTSLLTTALQGFKWRTGEQPKAAADAAQSLTDTSLDIVKELREDNKTLRLELATLKEQVTSLRAVQQENEDLRDWAERLVHQVRSLGIEPVKMRVKTVK